MSIVAFKRKSVIQYGSQVSGRAPGGKWAQQGPFGSHGGEPVYGNSGFSINGPYRNVGGVGKNMLFSKRGTPFRGAQPMGNGGTFGTYKSGDIFYNVNEVNALGQQYEYVKPSVLSTYGMLERKYKWINQGTQTSSGLVVKNIYTGNMTDTKSQGNYLQSLTVANLCQMDVNNTDKYVNYTNKCGPNLCKTSSARRRFDNIANNAPYTKNVKIAMDSSTYTLLKQRKCCPTEPASVCNARLEHLPVAYNGNGAPCTTPHTFENTRIPSITPPGAPTFLQYTTGYGNQVSILFNDPTNTGGAPILPGEEGHRYRISVPPGLHLTKSMTSGKLKAELYTWVNYTPKQSEGCLGVDITGLTYGIPYIVELEDANSAGWGEITTIPNVIPYTSPSPPTITYVTHGDGVLNVSFTDGYNGGLSITGYQYSIDNINYYDTIVGGTGSNHYFSIALLQNGVTYPVTVKEINNYSTSDASNIVEGTPSTTPSPPTITSINSGDLSLDVNFLPPGDDGGANIYNYKYSTDNGTSWQACNPPDAISPIVITTLSSDGTTPLTNGVTYQVMIEATNENGDSSQSNMVTGTPMAGNSQFKAIYVSSFYDNTTYDSSINSLSNTFSKIYTDQSGNIITGSHLRSGTFTLNKPDTDGINQVSVLSETYQGDVSFNAGRFTYYRTNLCITKYNSSGTPLWGSLINGTSNAGNTIYDIVCDNSNNVYAYVGNAVGIVSFYNADGTLFGKIDNTVRDGLYAPPGFASLASRSCLIKYNSSGQIQWINSITAVNKDTWDAVYIESGSMIIDSDDNIYLSLQAGRAGGGSGASYLNYYNYNGVDGSNNVLLTMTTNDSFPFGGITQVLHRAMIVQVSTSGTYNWVSRMNIPVAWGEQNGGTVNLNMSIDSSNNIYLCMNSSGASSPTCNIYDAVPMTSNPLPSISLQPYYRIDLRGASLASGPYKVGQYFRFVAAAKFNNNGVFQKMCCAHQEINSSIIMNMIPFIAVDKNTNSLYMTMNAQGYVGTNAMTGHQLNTLCVDNFSSIDASGVNYNIVVTPSMVMTLNQPQTIMATVKFDCDTMTSQAMTYVDTPSGNSSSFMSLDTNSNIYLTTTMQNNTSTNTIYTFNSVSGTDVSFNVVGTLSPTNMKKDGLFLSYSGDLKTLNWISILNSSSGLDDSGFLSVTDKQNNVYIGGTSDFSGNEISRYVNVFNFYDFNNPNNSDSLFGNINVSNSTTKAGYIIKYGKVSVKTPSAPTITSVSSGTSLNGSSYNLTINFTAPSDPGSSDITNYQYSTDNGNTYFTCNPSDISSPIVVIAISSDGTTPLSGNTTYNVKIKAVNSYGAGAASNSESATTSNTIVTPPNAPTLIYGLPSDGGIYVYFTPDNGGGGIFNYEYTTDGGDTTHQINPVNVNSPVYIGGLTNSNSYNIQLRAYNIAGHSNWSNVLSNITPNAASVPNALLSYDPNNSSSYSGSGNSVLNVGNYGTMTGTKYSGVSWVDGSGSIGRKVFYFNNSPGSGTYNISFGTFNFGSNFTISAWVYPMPNRGSPNNDSYNINGIVTNEGAAGRYGFRTQWNWWLGNSLVMEVQYGNSAGSFFDTYTVNNVVTLNQWQYLTYAFDKTNGVVIMYKNGIPAYSANGVTLSTGLDTNRPFTIGAYNGGSYGMKGQLGLVNIYNKTFNAADVLADFNSSKALFGL